MATVPRMEFGYLAAQPSRSGSRGSVTIRRKPVAGEAPASGTATSAKAPAVHEIYGEPICYARAAAADIYVAVGQPPNPNAEPRTLVRANSDEPISCDANDAAAWIAVP